MTRRVPHDAEPIAWTALAYPTHGDWGTALSAARAEMADLARTLAGGASPHAVVRARPAVQESRGEFDKLGDLGGAELADGRASGLVLGARDLDLALFAAEPSKAARPAEPNATSATPVVWLCPDGGASATEQKDAAGLAEVDTIHRVSAVYGDIWLRDTGPVFVETAQGLRAAAFRFNGWGGRYVYDGDERVARALAQIADAPLDILDMVGEPGAIEFDGEGTAIASRRCLLNANRNPQMSDSDVEAQLGVAFGVERVIWLEEMLLGDHTDGHADTLARFARPGLVVTEAPFGPEDPNATARDGVARRLDGARDAHGRAIDVVRIPGADGRDDGDGAVPASHTNYVFAPGRVIVPLYGGPQDTAVAERVLAAFAEVFAEREIVGLPCAALMTGGGGFHCVSRQAPEGARGPWDR